MISLRLTAPRSLALATCALVACALAACALALAACGKGPGGSAKPAPSGDPAGAGAALSASAAEPAGSAAAPASAGPQGVPVTAFEGAKSAAACKAQTVEIAAYQQQSSLALAGRDGGVAAVWRTKLAGKGGLQIAFASFDLDGKLTARPRGIGFSKHERAPQIFPTGADWTITWFDDNGLAYAKPRVEPLPLPDVSHVSAVAREVAADVALAPAEGGATLAAGPFGADRAQIGLFVFAPPDDGPAVRALGVTHHAKEPHRAAVASSASGVFVAWLEGQKIQASRFDPAGKESDACTVSGAPDVPRERLALAASGTGAIAMWMEGTAIRARALDRAGCPSSPQWTVADGKWATLVPAPGGAVVAWVGEGGKLLAAKLAANGAPNGKGIEVSDGSSGLKDAPSVVAAGARLAFGWGEAMSPVISTTRLVLRLVDAACLP